MRALIVSDYNRNAVWCEVLVAQLVACGLRDVVVCAGNRSSALVLTLAETPAVTAIPHIDERSGAFVALGLARASGRPVGITTTSGSAVANLTPALAEAHASGVALVVLSCDRPVAWRGAGAPQVADHLGASAPYVRAAVDLPEPAVDDAALRALQETVVRLLTRATAAFDPGPVHLNIPFHGRICPTEEEEEAFEPPAGLPAPLPAPPWPPPAAASGSTEGLRPGLRGLIYAGSICPLSPDEVAALAEGTGFPVLTDCPGLLRRPAIPNLIAAGDAIAWHPLFSEWGPEVVIRLGSAPITEAAMNLLSACSGPILRLDHRPVERDFLHPQLQVLTPPFAPALDRLIAALGPGDPDWLAFWKQAELRAQAARRAQVEAMPWGESQAAATVCAAEGFGFFHIANSMSVRHANLHLVPNGEDQPIFANRGVNGIDGTLGTFLGELLATGRWGLLLVGDQTVVHDLPALALLSQVGSPVNGTLCVMNNAGGSVFDMVACARFPNYRRFVRNAPNVSFAGVAATFGLHFEQVTDRAGLEAALQSAATRPGLGLLEVVVPDTGLRDDLVSLVGSMCMAISATDD